MGFIPNPAAHSWGQRIRNGNASWMQQIFSYIGNTNVYHCPGNVQLPVAEQAPFNYFNGARAAYVARQQLRAGDRQPIHFPRPMFCPATPAATPLAAFDADKDDYTQNCVGGPANGSPSEQWQVHSKARTFSSPTATQNGTKATTPTK